METQTEASLGALRGQLFQELISLRSGSTTATNAIAVSKLAQQVIDTYKTEIYAVQVADGLKERNITYKDNLKALER